MFAVPVVLALALPQGGDDLAIVRAAQAQRTGVVTRVAPAVCAVMPLQSAGGGSGVIIDPAGFVLTNFHVVQRHQKKRKPGKPDAQPPPPDGGQARPGAEPERPPLPAPAQPFEVPEPRYDVPTDDHPDEPAWRTMKIGLPDGELYLADVLGIDPGSDLAIMLLRPRADGRPYPAVELGDSDQLLVGEAVFAMGNPFLLATDFHPTVTWGVVSGTHRYQPGAGNRFLVYPDCVQVDAPVNPGNSGGPLFNERGEVVGINGRITVRDRGRVNTGVGFAIASNQIRNFLADLMAGRHTEHGTLDLNAWYMSAPDQKRRGVFVQATFADSVAASLGVGLGDELTTFNGQEIRSANQLATLVGVLPAHSWVSLGYRPLDRDNDMFGTERTIVFPLTRLDTGSSRDEDRIATDAQRRLAREVLARDVGAGESSVDGITVTLEPPADADGAAKVVLSRLGDRLRWQEGPRVWVRTAAGEGFAVEAGAARELTAEEGARLDRVLSCNPILWAGADRKRLVQDSLLDGGALVFGKPAYRFRLGGAGEREVLLYENGAAAGCRFRDPVARAVVEYRFRPDHGAARIVVDDAMRVGWTMSVGGAPAASAFERPGS